MLQPIVVIKKILIFAVENFSIEITTYKRKLSVNYKTEKDEKNQGKGAC